MSVVGVSIFPSHDNLFISNIAYTVLHASIVRGFFPNLHRPVSCKIWVTCRPICYMDEVQAADRYQTVLADNSNNLTSDIVYVSSSVGGGSSSSDVTAVYWRDPWTIWTTRGNILESYFWAFLKTRGNNTMRLKRGENTENVLITSLFLGMPKTEEEAEI